MELDHTVHNSASKPEEAEPQTADVDEVIEPKDEEEDEPNKNTKIHIRLNGDDLVSLLSAFWPGLAPMAKAAKSSNPVQAFLEVVEQQEAQVAARPWSERLERPFGCLVGVGVTFAWARYAGVDLDRPLESVSSLALAYSMGRALGRRLYPVNLRADERLNPLRVVVRGAWNFIWSFGAASVANWCWGAFADLFTYLFSSELPFMVSHKQLLGATIVSNIAADLLSAL